MTHTPTPWKYAPNTGPTKALIVDNEGFTIAEIKGSGSRFAGDLRHIVHAVNAHDHLTSELAAERVRLQTLEDALRHLKNCSISLNIYGPAYKLIDEALLNNFAPTTKAKAGA